MVCCACVSGISAFSFSPKCDVTIRDVLGLGEMTQYSPTWVFRPRRSRSLAQQCKGSLPPSPLRDDVGPISMYIRSSVGGGVLIACCLARWKAGISEEERHDCDSPRARYIFNFAKSGRCLVEPALAYLENDKHDIGKAIRYAQ